MIEIQRFPRRRLLDVNTVIFLKKIYELAKSNINEENIILNKSCACLNSSKRLRAIPFLFLCLTTYAKEYFFVWLGRTLSDIGWSTNQNLWRTLNTHRKGLQTRVLYPTTKVTSLTFYSPQLPDPNVWKYPGKGRSWIDCWYHTHMLASSTVLGHSDIQVPRIVY